MFKSGSLAFFLLLPQPVLWVAIILAPKLVWLTVCAVLCALAFYAWMLFAAKRAEKRLLMALGEGAFVDHPCPTFRDLFWLLLCPFVPPIVLSILLEPVRYVLETGGYTNRICWYLGFVVYGAWMYFYAILGVFHTWYWLRDDDIYILHGLHEICISYAAIHAVNDLSSRHTILTDRIVMYPLEITKPIVRLGGIVQIIENRSLLRKDDLWSSYYLTPTCPEYFVRQAKSFMKLERPGN